MVREITLKDTPLKLEGSLGGERPLYLLQSSDRRKVWVSEDLLELYVRAKEESPFRLSPRGISFLLLSGVIPTPWTVLENLFVLNIGDSVEIRAERGQLKLHFHHFFPFSLSQRSNTLVPDENQLLSLLAEAVFTRWRPSAPVYLFQSLGKDSNTLALALFKAGFRDLICLTLSTGDRKDESSVAEKIARRLGFRHHRLKLPLKISPRILSEIEHYFREIPLPCADGVSLAYPLYALEIDFAGANVIDGSGNDIYFGHVPRPVEYRRQKIYPHLLFLRPLADRLPTGNPFQKVARTRSEMVGAWGFTLRDARLIYPESESVLSYWKTQDKKHKGWDYLDMKADIWGPNFEFDRVMRKVRNFAAVYRAHLLLPWTAPEVVSYVGNLPEKYLLDRRTFRNKILLRDLLRKHLGLDSDVLGKYSYGFNAYEFLQKMRQKALEEILDCPLWDPSGIRKVFQRLDHRAREGDRRSRKLWVRLYLLSAWYNHNRYLERT